MAARACPRPRGRASRPRGCGDFFATAHGRAGADRASDRSAPQEHDRPRDGGRRPARRARPQSADPGGAGGQRGGVAPRRADPVADQPAAPHPAAGHRRGDQRPLLLRLHVPAASCRASMPALEEELAAEGRGPVDGGSPRSCASAAGSAATATAIRSSPRACCAPHCARRAAAHLRIYLDELHLLGGELSLDGRLVGVSTSVARAGRALARPLAVPRRTSPIGGRSPASTRGLRRPRATLDQLRAAAAAGRRRAALRDSGELLGRSRR